MIESAGVLRWEHIRYGGRPYDLPTLDPREPIVLRAEPARARPPSSPDGLVVAGIADPSARFAIGELLRPRRPASLGVLEAAELALFARPGAARVLDLPIKFPDHADYRLPRALAQFAPTIRRIIDTEHAVDATRAHESFAYLTIDQGLVPAGQLMRDAPCHVDGLQGARWYPRCRPGHSYTVSDVLPTAYYVQPFDLRALDERIHNYFSAISEQVADSGESHRWQPAPGELTVMDCYCVHRGVAPDAATPRTWLRLSYEDRRRIYDRLGNTHNPLFDYAWDMVERDIEQLALTAPASLRSRRRAAR